MKNNEGVKNRNLAIAMTTIELLKNGVECGEDEFRNFDIIDYYQITRISPKTIFESTDAILQKFCTKEDYQSFYSFALKHGDTKKMTIKEVMEMKHSIMVNDKVKEISLEEKAIAINFLSMNGINLLTDTYSAAIKRELAGTLNFEEKNEKVRTLKR